MSTTNVLCIYVLRHYELYEDDDLVGVEFNPENYGVIL
jgi:hypothetical protein